MIESTKTLLGRPSWDSQVFNLRLVAQIGPYLRGLNLEGAKVKFTGDGWLIFDSGLSGARKLCCLALIMSRQFRTDMTGKGEDPDGVPPLRSAICEGHDVSVALPTGEHDWVGHSARRAVRSSCYCKPDEVLVSESVRSAVVADFRFSGPLEDMTARGPRCKEEENLVLHVLEDLGENVRNAQTMPWEFLFTLDKLGNTDRARELAESELRRLMIELDQTDTTSNEDGRLIRDLGRLINRAPDFSMAETALSHAVRGQVKPTARLFARLISRAPTYQKAQDLLARMQRAGISPDKYVIAAMIECSPSYDEGVKWLDLLGADSMDLDVHVFNTLMSSAPDHNAAHSLYERARHLGLEPDTRTFSILVHKAQSYEAARGWLQAMRDAGHAPNVVAYTSLMGKASDFGVALQVLEEMDDLGIAPDATTFGVLVGTAGSYEEALQAVELSMEAGVPPNRDTASLLISKAPDYAAAAAAMESMMEAGVRPSASMFLQIVNRATDFATATEWIERMEDSGVKPRDGTYEAAIRLGAVAAPSTELLAWYRERPYRRDRVIEVAIRAYAEAGELEDALDLILAYPHLGASRHVMRSIPAEAEQRYRSLYDQQPNHPNAAYALGLTLLETGRRDEANPILEHALELASSRARRRHLRSVVEPG